MNPVTLGANSRLWNVGDGTVNDMAGDHDVPVPRTGFSIARRGYDQAQVDSHLRRLDAEVRMLAADRDAAVAQNTRLSRELDDARTRAEAMQQQVNRLAGPPQSVQGMSERLRSMLRLAEDEVAEMHAAADREIAEKRRRAEEHARTVVEDARVRAEQTLAQAEATAAEAAHRSAERERAVEEKQSRVERELAALRERTEAELAERRRVTEAELVEQRTTTERDLAEQRSSTERELTEAERTVTARITRADTEARENREQVEHDFRIAMDQRRTEALTSLFAERDALEADISRREREAAERIRRDLDQARADGEKIRSDARRDAEETTSAAQRRVEQLIGLRARVAEQLRGARSLIESGVDDLDAGPALADLPADGPPAGQAPVEQPPAGITEPRTTVAPAAPGAADTPASTPRTVEEAVTAKERRSAAAESEPEPPAGPAGSGSSGSGRPRPSPRARSSYGGSKRTARTR